MAGIYIHIPFCHKKCHYCDFYKTTQTVHIEQFTKTLLKEINLRSGYLGGEKIETVYFGGGTPSVMESREIDNIINHLNRVFEITADAEITFEANPDDLTFAYLEDLKKTGINRLSIGIQSFDDSVLQMMNRRHNAGQAILAIENAIKAGFSSISIDLIYGVPEMNLMKWQDSLNQALSLPVDHLSAYHLTYHPGTVFYKWLRQNKIAEINEEESILQFNYLINKGLEAGFEQYEISNFAKRNRYSRHNSAYWSGKKYLGLGPSAHSFDGGSRQWNVSSVVKYLSALSHGEPFFKKEILNENDLYNEFIITNLRTKWGIDLTKLAALFGETKRHYFQKQAEKFTLTGKIVQSGQNFTLSHDGQLVSDDIMANLVIV